ncbi:GLPGLI family protein [Gramella sp. GC03-9]|uniref:GLPGLI family protein n=1 Tax=Christiangramia oceanisediminis TaxID=2920386 RepID=A0A9X2I1G9_9FLAO|nr:GLPGLI family protein [Gramella oceanisediminis]MCP9198905.1 GLPGLI family protein [Gramella oceanisediminis]
MKKMILLILFAPLLCFSQEDLKDRFNYQVIYKLSFQLDSTNIDSRKSEYMRLYLGDDYSQYISRAKTLANKVVVKGNSGHTAKSALTNFHYQIVKNYKQEELYYLLKIPKTIDRFYYPQDSNLFDWSIENETKKIKDYQVQKATTSFAGRDYIAWFTPEIPIADGPYKFNGLPRLILEIHDTKNYWNFEFFGFKKLSPREDLEIELNKFKKITQEELEELWYRYRRDPMGYDPNPNVKMDPEVHQKYIEAFTDMLKKENNPLELD